MPTPLRLLLIVNAVATAAAGLVLFLWPAAIPATIGIALPPDAAFLAWLLASAELGLAALCALALRARSPETLRLVCWTMLITHFTAALADALALPDHFGPVLIANLALRVAMVGLFWWFGVRALSNGHP